MAVTDKKSNEFPSIDYADSICFLLSGDEFFLRRTFGGMAQQFQEKLPFFFQNRFS